VAGDFEDEFFKRRGLLGGSALFSGELSGSGLVLNLVKSVGQLTHLTSDSKDRRDVEAGVSDGRRGRAHRDLKIHHLLGKGAHFIVEAELVFALILGCEDRI